MKIATSHIAVPTIVTALAIATIGVVVGVSAAGANDGDPTVGYNSTRIVNDTFNRTVSSGFGTAEMGGTYTQINDGFRPAGTNPPGVTNVSPGSANFMSVAPAHSIDEVLNDTAALDVSGQLTFTIPRIGQNAFGDYSGIELRRQSNLNYYSARVKVGAGGAGSISVIHQRSAGGSSPYIIPDISIGHVTPGQKIVVQMAIIGSTTVTISARAWTYGSVAPAWTTKVDTTGFPITLAGTTGVFAYTSGGTSPTDTHLIYYAVSSLSKIPASTPAPTTTAPTTPPTTASSTPAPTTTTPSSTSSTPTQAPTTPSSPPTTTAPAAPPVTAPSSGKAGSVPVGTASYSVPNGAVFVSTSGSDGSGDGSVGAPYATVRTALTHISNGGTVVVRGGTYNQNTFVPATLSNITIQSYPGEAVWFDGSIPVNGWTQSGSTWVHSGWTTQFDSSASFTTGSNAGGFVNASYPMAAHPDEVFLDGSQLVQVASNPGAGQFAVDYNAQTITVGSDPNGHAMRASNLSQAFVIAAGYLTLRGFGVQNYATPLPAMGTVYQGGSIGHGRFENLVIRNNATTGLNVTQPGNVITHVTADYNGMSGMQVGTNTYGQNGAGETVANCEISYNDTEGFVGGPATGALKVGRMNGIAITNNVVQNNFQSAGIWTDQSVTNFQITGNTVTGNGASYGILTELSDTGVVANNVISGSKYGYTAFDTGNVRVYNNTITGSTVWQLGLSQDARYQQSNTYGAPWLVQNVVADNNYLGTGASFQFYAMDKETSRSASSMNITLTGNEFTTNSVPTSMVGWGTDHRTVNIYNSPDALNAALGTTWRNAQVSTSGIQPAASALDSAIAEPLPADIAAMIGVPAGTAQVGAF